MNVLITGAWNCTEKHIAKIESFGNKVYFQQFEEDVLPCAYDDIDAVICNGLFLAHPIYKFKNLRYIQLTSAGFDRVPMDYVREHKIKIKNARGVYSVPMAEFAVSGVLQLYKQSRFFYDNQKSHRWDKHRGLIELNGKTVCIVGCGSVGTECAKRFSAFGCRVIGVDLFPYESSIYEEMVGIEGLDDKLSLCDIIVLTVPLTEQTEHLIGEKQFVSMKQGSVLVNIARGAIIDTEKLIPALEEKLRGVVLDVFEEEPLAESNPLWNMENVILTPHNSFVADGNNRRLAGVIIKNMEQFKNENSCSFTKK